METISSKYSPNCAKETCFACIDGKCIALTDNRFIRGCPFYKDKKEKEIEDILCDKRVREWKANGKKRLV